MTGVSVLRLFVHRYRKLYVGMVIYLVALAGVAQLPKGAVPFAMVGSLLAPFFLGLFATIAAFANPDSDLAGETSGYPPFLLRLPVRSRTLAVWPMVGVSLWGAAIWVGLSSLYLLPAGMYAPVWWPTVLIAALGVTLQAILWMPFRTGAIRLILAILVPISLVVFGVWAMVDGWAAWKIATVFALEGLLAAGLAAHAVARARITGAMRSVEKERTFKDKAVLRAAFNSAERAQFWVEWRKEGRLLPLITGLMLVALSVPLIWERARYEVNSPIHLLGNTWVWSMIPALVWIPLLVATVLGMGASKSYMRSPEGSYHLFFATRPLSSAAMLRAKYLSITAGVVSAWLLTVGVIICWLLMPAEDDRGRVVSSLALLLEQLPVKDQFAFVAVAGLLGLWTWRNQIVGVMAQYAPIPSIRGIYALAVTAIGGGLIVFEASTNHFFSQTKNGGPIVAVLAGVVAVKMVAAFWIGRRLASIRPTESRRVWLSALTWPVCGLAFGLAAYFFVYYPYQGADLLLPTALVLLALILVPLVRPMAARLSIEVGRHR